MKHCPSTDCPHRRAVGTPAEFVDDERTSCSDCGTTLVEGAAPVATTAHGPVPASLRGRLAITLLAPAGAILASFVPVPGLDVDTQLHSDPALAMFSVVHLGIAPVIVGSLLVELAAFAVPRWRALRHDREGRRRLWRAALVATLVAAGLQAFSVVRFLGAVRYDAGAGAMAVIWVTLIAGTFGLMALAELVRSRGLAPGLAVLAVTAVVPEVRRLVLDESGEATLTPYGLVTRIGPLVITALATAWILSAHRRVQPHRALHEGDGESTQDPSGPYRAAEPRLGPPPPTVRLPASGMVPLLIVPGLALLAFRAGAVPSNPRDGTSWAAILQLAATLALGAALALSSARPMELSKLWARATDRRWEPIDERRAAALRRPILKRTLGYLLLVALLAQTAAVDVWSLCLVALAVAVLLDVNAEWQARHDAGDDLVFIREEPRVTDADAAVAALDRAGIPAHARGIHFRSLLRSLGPFAPLELMVPRAHAAEAERILEALHA